MSRGVVCEFCGYEGQGFSHSTRLVDVECHEAVCPKRPQAPTDPDAAQAKDEKEMAMYVVLRVINGAKLFAGNFGLKYKTFELAKAEAKRLVELYAAEKPRYEIYELVYHCAVEASIDLRVT